MNKSIPIDQKIINELLASGFVWDHQTKCYIGIMDAFHVSINPETRSISVKPFH